MISQKLEVKFKQNLTKQKLKTLFKNIDASKSGGISPAAFFDILHLHKVALTPEVKEEIEKTYRIHTKAGTMIDFKTVVNLLIKTEKQEWGLHKPQ